MKSGALHLVWVGTVRCCAEVVGSDRNSKRAGS